jgi:hypothetical protein
MCDSGVWCELTNHILLDLFTRYTYVLIRRCCIICVSSYWICGKDLVDIVYVTLEEKTLRIIVCT